jgi:hypothetical protein
MADSKSTKKADDAYEKFSERVLAELPADLKADAELKPGGGSYALLRIRSRTVASIRSKNARITHPHSGTAADAKRIAKLAAAAAPAKEEPKAEEEAASE